MKVSKFVFAQQSDSLNCHIGAMRDESSRLTDYQGRIQGGRGARPLFLVLIHSFIF